MGADKKGTEETVERDLALSCEKQVRCQWKRDLQRFERGVNSLDLNVAMADGAKACTRESHNLDGSEFQVESCFRSLLFQKNCKKGVTS